MHTNPILMSNENEKINVQTTYVWGKQTLKNVKPYGYFACF